jgi:hypothetical protein
MYRSKPCMSKRKPSTTTGLTSARKSTAQLSDHDVDPRGRAHPRVPKWRDMAAGAAVRALMLDSGRKARI